MPKKPAGRASAKVAPVRGATLRELASAAIERALFTGRFAPGEAVTIAALSGEMGIGVTPVREAVQQLASEGAFELLPNRSVRVPDIDARDLGDLFEARLLLESQAAAYAAARMTADEAAAIAARLATLEKRLAKGSALPALEANFEFHFAIYRAARSPYVLDMIERLWLRMSPLQVKVFDASRADQADFFSAMPLHRALVEALKKKDAERARAHLTRMLTQSRDWHLKALAKAAAIEPDRERR